MYEIEFYEKENGESDVWDFLEELREKSEKSKDARIQYNQLMLHI
ncbi:MULTISPECIES: addiction module toxin RelE [Ruminococcus]|nr:MULTISPECIES: addiction module toxin RelE [Ruminococcus]